MLVPELVGRQRRGHMRNGVVLEHVARLQAGDGYMTFAVVAVGWRFAKNVWGEILGSGGLCLDHPTVRFTYADVVHVQLLGGGGISENQLPQPLDAGLALHPDHRRRLAHARAIVFEANQVVHAIEHGGLFGDSRLIG